VTRIACLFPGQGAQFVGMGLDLIADVPAAARLFDQASEILGYDLADLCLHGPPERLNSTACSQPAIFVASLAAWEALRVRSPEVVKQCQAMAGLSLGEYTALVAAGAIDFRSGLRLVQVRGEAMQRASDASPSGMLSILGLDEDRIRTLCDSARHGDTLQVANLLCPGNIVASGSQDACQRLATLAEEAGAMKVIPLAVAGAFHTRLMEPASQLLAEAVADCDIRVAQIPVISNVDASPHRDPEAFRELLIGQLVRPVLWEASMRHLLQERFDQFYEVGPGRVLRGLLRRIERKVSCECVAA